MKIIQSIHWRRMGCHVLRWKGALRCAPTLLLSLSLASIPSSAEDVSEVQARCGVVTGDVGLLPNGADDWIAPHEGLPLESGDSLRTGEDGRVELILEQNVLWRLEPGTELLLERNEPHGGRYQLESGSLIGKIDSSRTGGFGQNWEFNTPVVTVAVRGTEFAIQFSKIAGGRVGVFEGTVELQPAETAEGMQPSQQISAGQEAVAKRGRRVEVLKTFSPGMKSLASWRAVLRSRQRQIQRTWSPHTPTYRKELRARYVKPLTKKPKRYRPRPNRPRRQKPENSY
jgi:hypothetical protein